MDTPPTPAAAMDDGQNQKPTWCDRLLRWLSPCIDTLVIGNSDNLPAFICKRHSGLIDTFERMVASLFDSTIDFRRGKQFPELEALEEQFTVLRSKMPGARSTVDMDERFRKLLEIDAKLIALLPIDLLQGRHWMMIDRLRRVAPERAIALYEASNPAAMLHGTETLKDDDPKARKIRADVISINNYLQQLNIHNVQREYALASIKWWLVTRLFIICGAMAILLGIVAIPSPFEFGISDGMTMMVGITLIFLGGMAGAITSIGRKFQDIAARNVLISDPFNDIISLNSGRQSVAFSILVGGVFAIFVYLLIVSGSADKLGLNLVLFPSIQAQTSVFIPKEPIDAPPSNISARGALPAGGSGAEAPDTSASAAPTASPVVAPLACCVADQSAHKKKDESSPALVTRVPRKQDESVLAGVEVASKALGFFYHADILRMLLLAFLAGFAERLVPDAIDRLARRERSSALRG